MIYYNLDESHIKFKYNQFTFYFSSEFYYKKFKKLYPNYIKTETEKLRIKYKSNFVFDEMLLISLYQKIEKRGFKIQYNNEDLKNYYIENQIIVK